MIAAPVRLPPSPAREFAFDQRDFSAIATMISDAAGIVLPPAKAQLVYARLGKHVRARGLDSFAAYVALLERDPAERATAVYALTTNHTKFFREDHHFDHFRRDPWPRLRTAAEGGGRVRLWSAGCSSGEEPYSLAMTMLGPDRAAGTRLAATDLRILATDLSPPVLAAARTARYPADALEVAPSALRSAWTRRVGDQVEIHPACRAIIAYRQLNLLGDWPMRGRFDAIFCRNVMIYFDDPTKVRLQSRFAERLDPGGLLYIGHSERLLGPAAATFRPVGQTIYQKIAA